MTLGIVDVVDGGAWCMVHSSFMAVHGPLFERKNGGIAPRTAFSDDILFS